MRKEFILIADNDSVFLKSRAELLEENGYRVVQASSPREAERIMKEGRVDLAILDIRLVDDKDEKDVSGLKLAAEIARFLPKVIMTNYPNSQNTAVALKPQLDGLPSAVEFVDKQGGAEALLEAVRSALGPDLLWMHTVRNALGGIDDQLTLDYKNAQNQANFNYFWALIFAIIGTVVVLIGVGLAFWQKLEISIVSTLAGVVTETTGYLFYRRVDKANDRMDNYHRERLEGQRFDILLKACEGLETPKEREACQKEIVLTSLASWLNKNGKTTVLKENRNQLTTSDQP